jgi:uncharacterized protein (DUF4415 family)
MSINVSKLNNPKGKTAPSFNDVGTPPKKEEEVNQEEMNQEVEETEEQAETEEEMTIDKIVETVTNAPKAKPKEQVSIYLDADVKKAFDRFAKQNGHGSRSTLVNNFLKKALKDYIK